MNWQWPRSISATTCWHICQGWLKRGASPGDHHESVAEMGTHQAAWFHVFLTDWSMFYISLTIMLHKFIIISAILGNHVSFFVGRWLIATWNHPGIGKGGPGPNAFPSPGGDPGFTLYSWHCNRQLGRDKTSYPSKKGVCAEMQQNGHNNFMYPGSLKNNS